MKDVAYFIGSCLHEDECEQLEAQLLDVYFEALKIAVLKKGTAPNAEALEREWRVRYRVAWTDFHRFYKGWSGTRFGKNSYSERVAQEVVALLTRAL
jgi:hypothetical protein